MTEGSQVAEYFSLNVTGFIFGAAGTGADILNVLTHGAVCFVLYALCRINVTKCRSDFRFKNRAASLTNLLIKTVIIAGRLCVGFNKFIVTEFFEYFFIKDAVADRASVSVIAVLKAGCVLMLMI